MMLNKIEANSTHYTDGQVSTCNECHAPVQNCKCPWSGIRHLNNWHEKTREDCDAALAAIQEDFKEAMKAESDRIEKLEEKASIASTWMTQINSVVGGITDRLYQIEHSLRCDRVQETTPEHKCDDSGCCQQKDTTGIENFTPERIIKDAIDHIDKASEPMNHTNDAAGYYTKDFSTYPATNVRVEKDSGVDQDNLLDVQRSLQELTEKVRMIRMCGVRK